MHAARWHLSLTRVSQRALPAFPTVLVVKPGASPARTQRPDVFSQLRCYAHCVTSCDTPNDAFDLRSYSVTTGQTRQL